MATLINALVPAIGLVHVEAHRYEKRGKYN